MASRSVASQLAAMAALLGAACGGEAPDYDRRALERLQRPLPPEVVASPSALRVGTVVADVDGEGGIWPLLMNAGFRVGSQWRWEAAADGGGVAHVRLRGDARAQQRFEIDLAITTGDELELGSVAGPIRLRARLPGPAGPRLMTFVPAADGGLSLDAAELLPGDDLVVRGSFHGTLQHAGEAIEVANGSFEARVRRAFD